MPEKRKIATKPDSTTEYDQLVDLIYHGALEERPWQNTLPALRAALDAQVVSLILRPPSPNDTGYILNCVRASADGNNDGSIAANIEGKSGSAKDSYLADPNDWEASAYKEEFFALDPFVNLPHNSVVALEDILPDSALTKTDYYEHYLKPINLFRILGVDTVEPGGMLARLRISRRKSERRFAVRERKLLSRLIPHITRALEIYARLNRTSSERDIYAGAVDQLSVATIIVDEEARVLTTNAVGKALLSQPGGLTLSNGHLSIEGRDINKELQQALTTIISAQRQGEASVVRALRVPRKGQSDLGLVVRPVPSMQHGEGQASPAAALFISDPDLPGSTSQQTLRELFSLTPAEARLATLLALGLSLADVSNELHISQHTARAQLKSIFAKTDVSRQAELVRLVLKSVAALA